MKTKIPSFVVTLLIVCLGASQNAYAVTPAPDGDYFGGNTAEGENALLSLTRGRFNSAIGWSCLISNTGGNFNTAIGSAALNGVMINSGAQFSFGDVGNGMLAHGIVFTVINNIAANPIIGTFSNLPDGGTFTSNGNTYQVNYDGGDGNDLTLTVIP